MAAGAAARCRATGDIRYAFWSSVVAGRSLRPVERDSWRSPTNQSIKQSGASELELGELAFFCCCDSDTDNRPQEHKKEETGSFKKEMSLSHSGCV